MYFSNKKDQTNTFLLVGFKLYIIIHTNIFFSSSFTISCLTLTLKVK